jgi:hypothetical protein
MANMRIVQDTLDAEPLQAVTAATQQLFAKVEECAGVTTDPKVTWDLCDSVWPALKAHSKPLPEFRLMPLSRLGASEGQSGSKVMIGYFVDSSGRLSASRPMVLKFQKLEKGGRDQLNEEQEQFEKIRPHVAYHKDGFAVPLISDTCEGYSFLWSPFTFDQWSEAVDPLGNRYLTLSHNDLWTQLRMQSSSEKHLYAGKKQDLLQTVFTYLSPLHNLSGLAQCREDSLGAEYQRYLRGVWGSDPSSQTQWWKTWEVVWAPDTKERVTAFGAEHANPVNVLAGLKGRRIRMYCGAVHGDLHPKNIVLSKRTPHLIDFGWANDDAHIAKDFVLLECNLRFMLLRPDVDEDSVRQFAGWIGLDKDPPELTCDYCTHRIELIKGLHDIARLHFPTGTDWNLEYVVPLFLVAFGLLKHLASAENQFAAQMTVLSLADYIRSNVLKA